jgi:hypothetical protein
MTKQTGIWIDSTKAIIVTLQNGKESINEIESNLKIVFTMIKKEIKAVFLTSTYRFSKKD